MLLFDGSQTQKIVLTVLKFGNFQLLRCFQYVLKFSDFEVIKNVKILKFEGGWNELYRSERYFLQIILFKLFWKKFRNQAKLVKNRKLLSLLLHTLCHSYIFGRDAGQLAIPPPISTIFLCLIISYNPQSYVVQQLKG